MVHGYLGETCSGMLREHWDADSSWLFWGGIMKLWGKGLVQMLLRIPWSSVSDLLVLRGPEWWNGTLSLIGCGENPTNCGSIFLVGKGKRGALGVLGVFPAAGHGPCALDVGQAVTVGFSQHIQTSLSLGHLEWFISHLFAKISHEHFPSTISNCGLGLGFFV